MLSYGSQQLITKVLLKMKNILHYIWTYPCYSWNIYIYIVYICIYIYICVFFCIIMYIYMLYYIIEIVIIYIYNPYVYIYIIHMYIYIHIIIHMCKKSNFGSPKRSLPLGSQASPRKPSLVRFAFRLRFPVFAIVLGDGNCGFCCQRKIGIWMGYELSINH